jgi:hypothetical protein
MLNKSQKVNKFFWKDINSKQKKKTPTNRNYLKYNLRFVSIISPGSVTNLRLMQLGSKSPTTHHNKLILKQSYFLLTWLVYVQNSGKTSSSVPSFFIQPKKQTKFTHLKAPMAHKTFSQEQFVFKHYTIVISFKVLISESPTLNKINDAIFLILSIRNSIPFFNTNLLFLKRINFSFSSSDNFFLKLY